MDKNPLHATGNPSRRIQPTLLAIAVATLFSTGSALAEPMFQQSIMPKPDNSRWIDNYVELGAGAIRTNSANEKAYKFGEFTGLTDKESFGIAGLNWIFQSLDDDTYNLRMHAQDLAQETRKISIEGGKQGTIEASLSAERLTRAEISPAKFIYTPESLGTSYLQNIAARPLNNAGRAAFFADQDNYTPFDIEQTRDIFKFGLKGLLGPNWKYDVKYREDVRDGTRLTGLYFSSPTGSNHLSARNPVVVPYAIDDKTQNIDLSLGYASKPFEAQLAYAYSRYVNNYSRFNVDNPNALSVTPPTSLSNPVNPSTNSGNPSPLNVAMPIAQLSLAPDNEFHQISATAAINFTKHTRAKAKIAVSNATQNETYLPYNSFGAGYGTTGLSTTPTNNTTPHETLLPQTSLNGEVNTTVADVTLTTKPVDAMNLKLGYWYRDVDNKTPRNTYLYAGRDGAQPNLPDLTDNTPGVTSNMRTNAPVSTTEQRATIDLDYALTPSTVVRGLYEHTIKDYTLSDVTQTKTDRASLDLRKTFSSEFIGNLGYTFTQNKASAYDKNVYLRETYAPEVVNGYNPSSGTPTLVVGTYMTNHPSMRNPMYNDYDEQRVRSAGNWVATETLTLGASIDGYDRQYGGKGCDRAGAPLDGITLPDTCLGVRRTLGGAATIDAQLLADEDLFFFGFLTATNSETRINQRDWQRPTSWTAINHATRYPQFIANLASQSNDWNGTFTYTDETAGIGARWNLTSKLEVGGQYVYSVGTGSAEFSGSTPGSPTPVINPGNMPDTESKLQTVDLYAKWTYNSKLQFRVNYVYEKLKITDWGYDPFTDPTTRDGLLLTGQVSPAYENHLIGVSVAISSW